MATIGKTLFAHFRQVLHASAQYDQAITVFHRLKKRLEVSNRCSLSWDQTVTFSDLAYGLPVCSKHWEVMSNFKFRDEPRKLRLLITSQWIWIEKNPTVHLHYFIHRVRQNCQANHFPIIRERFLVSFSKFWIWRTVDLMMSHDFCQRIYDTSPRGMFGQHFTSLQVVEGV